MLSLKRVAAVLLPVSSFFLHAPAHVQTFPLRDATGLIAPRVKAESAAYLGRKSVRITMEGDDHDGLALLPGTENFQDGTIEADIALKVTMPPEVRYPGFIGIAFRARSDTSHFELFYVRPGNSDAPDQLTRDHAVQYSSEPNFGWYDLRRAWPGAYEANADIAPNAWTHLRIVVAGRSAKLYLNGSSHASLVVNDLKGEDLRGAIGLWGFTDEECYFSNVRITPATPVDIKNGSDAAGSWEMRYFNDVTGMAAQMDLQRNGDKLTGTWSGPLGKSLPITGTWRNGYVELSFAGEWPSTSRKGTPGPVTTYMTGWFDGDSAKGRMRVSGRSDGTWAAERKH